MRLGGEAAVTFYGKAQGLASNGVHDLLATRGGRLWAATDGGLSVWDGTGWRTETAAGRKALFALGEDDSGTLWAGGNDGIHRWDGGTLRPFRIDEPACAGRVLSLLPAGTELWWTGDRGVCRGTAKDGVIRAVLAAPISGVRTEMISQPAAVQGADGALWFATAAGVLRIPPTKRSPPAPVVIEAVRIEGRTIEKPAAAEMQPGEQNLEIEYAGLDLARTDSVRYRYRLAGLAEEWTDAGRRRLVTYSHLPRREYVFEVCTRGEDGTWGPPARLDLRLEPYFYQRGWFLALAGAVLLAAAYGLHRWRLRVAEQRMRSILEERTRIARELHDTLAQSIGGISSQLEAARMLQGAAPERSLTHVDRARGMASAALEDMRTFVRDLRHSPAAEGPIDEVLRSIARGADAEMRVEIAGRPRVLRESLRTCLFRIAQEAVRNAQRHGGAGHVEVRLEYGKSGVRLRVYDDGAGFDPSSAPTETQFGLKGMQERAAHEGGTLAITSRPGGGCTVELSAPYG
jgi:signal transduction histidine kinase